MIDIPQSDVKYRFLLYDSDIKWHNERETPKDAEKQRPPSYQETRRTLLKLKHLHIIHKK